MTSDAINPQNNPATEPDLFSRGIQKLWCLGDLSLLNLPKVSIVGTRRISADGQARTIKLTAELVDRGFCIVSGLATGVDMIAHKTALRRGGKTIAVMGTPIDQCFPKENEWLKKEIAEKGLVLSQFPPGSPIHRSNFPRRNEVMALLSAVTFVVEAQIDSGTRHQVAASLTLGKKVAFLNSVAEQNFPWVKDTIQTGNGVIIKNTDDAVALLSAVIPSKPPSTKARSDSGADSAQFQFVCG
jgi:DNA processing protein